MIDDKSNRLALGVSYQGMRYYGWQRQKHSNNTVQFHVEEALSKIADETITTLCAGRTDSGVHGTGQVIHFDTSAERSMHSWRMGANTYLPTNIRINWAQQVDADFHARFSATYRRYHYVIEDNSRGNAIFDGLVTPCRYPLNERAMNQAAQYLLGEKDFSSFRAAQCQSNTPFRCIDAITVDRSANGQFIVVDIKANAFLYHMVRNIVGALLMVGREKYEPAWIAEILAKKDRTQSPATALADGLYLVEVGYPAVYNMSGGDVPFPL